MTARSSLRLDFCCCMLATNAVRLDANSLSCVLSCCICASIVRSWSSAASMLASRASSSAPGDKGCSRRCRCSDAAASE
eukprot:7636791-Alexandrium_andersonii.AAC.1